MDSQDKALWKEAQKREDLEETVNQMMAGTYEPKVSFEELDKTYTDSSPGFDEALDVWAKLKVERNAYHAIFLKEIWDMFADKREALLKSVSASEGKRLFNEDGDNRDNDLFQLSMALNSLFHQALQKWVIYRESRITELEDKPYSEWPPEDQNYFRFNRVVEFGGRNQCEVADTVSLVMLQGFGTARKTSVAMIREVERLMPEDSDIEDLAKCLRHGSTFSNAAILAGMHKSRTVPILDAIGTTTKTRDYFFDKDWFSLKEDQYGKKIVIDHGRLMTIRHPTSGKPIFNQEMRGPNTGCPALVRINGEPSVIEENYEYMARLAEVYYYPNTKAKK